MNTLIEVPDTATPTLYCPHCNGVLEWLLEDGSSYRDNRHDLCYKLKKFEKLSIFSKNEKLNTFERAQAITEKEKLFIKQFKTYCNKFEEAKKEGVGMLFSGNAGTGKTFFSNCISNELRANKHTVLSFNLSGYFSELKNSFGKVDKVGQKIDLETEFNNAVREVDLTVIDDVGSEVISEWGKERVFNLMNTIYLHKKAVIITTNLDSQGLKEHFSIYGSDKIFDRLLELCKPFKFDWESRRQSIGKEKFKSIW